jgi:poly-gamma-glutamate capsule biosynthesis protein CapA/YwtB (metallophosphatase superfamily)
MNRLHGLGGCAICLATCWALLCACLPHTVTALTDTAQPGDNLASAAQSEVAAVELEPTGQAAARVRVALPPQWLAAVRTALDESDGPWRSIRWILSGRVDPRWDELSGQANLWLVTGEEGLFIARRSLALAVPLTNPLEGVDLDEAMRILREGSPGVEIVDWAALPAMHKALRVDGLHPADAGYPLQQVWSLVFAPGYRGPAEALAPLLRAVLADTQVLHLAAVGDLVLDRNLGAALTVGRPGFPFGAVQPILGAADLAIGNLECAIGDTGSAQQGKGYLFLAPPQAVPALAEAGFDILSLANNHAMDYGVQALEWARDALNRAGVRTVGAGGNAAQAHAPLIEEVNGLRLAFLAYVDVPDESGGFSIRSWIAEEDTPGMALADAQQMTADIRAARDAADLVVVLLHSGKENRSTPDAAQVAAAHAAIDAGAHLVLGHHPHTLQGIEFYKQGVIAYSLGNFAFAQPGIWESLILHVWLDGGGVREVEILPVVIQADGSPRPCVGAECRVIAQSIYALTESLNP